MALSQPSVQPPPSLQQLASPQQELSQGCTAARFCSVAAVPRRPQSAWPLAQLAAPASLVPEHWPAVHFSHPAAAAGRQSAEHRRQWFSEQSAHRAGHCLAGSGVSVAASPGPSVGLAGILHVLQRLLQLPWQL